MNTVVFICGVHSIGFGIFHILFWKILKWDTELKKIGYINRGVMQMLNIKLILIAFAVGIMCFVFPSSLIHTGLGNFIMAMMSVFWFVRLIEQFIFLRINDWRIHLLSFLFLAGAVLFCLPVVAAF